MIKFIGMMIFGFGCIAGGIIWYLAEKERYEEKRRWNI